jgi:hypothetical protein
MAIGEVLFLLWGIKVCYNVRNAESLYNEAKLISYAIYNIAFVNILMVAIQWVNWSDWIQLIKIQRLEDEFISLPSLSITLSWGLAGKTVKAIDRNKFIDIPHVASFFMSSTYVAHAVSWKRRQINEMKIYAGILKSVKYLLLFLIPSLIQPVHISTSRSRY